MKAKKKDRCITPEELSVEIESKLKVVMYLLLRRDQLGLKLSQ